MKHAASLTFYESLEQPVSAAQELLDGLLEKPRWISPKYFYDEKGSELFTRITQLPEYYPTRTEMSLLERIAPELSRLIGKDSVVIEYGSGNSEKIRLLLQSIRPSMYVPLDISRDYLEKSASGIAREFPWLDVRAACVDYSTTFELPFDLPGKKLGFFPGSSIGNFSRSEAFEFLCGLRSQLGTDGALLVGVDMKKDPLILNRAYNDSQGVTAAFNLNVLTHLNREFQGNFCIEHFEHHAAWNPEEGCVQMFLVSKRDQRVELAGKRFLIGRGEQIHTENSHKYGKDEFLDMASRAGFKDHHCWQDQNGWFSLFYLY